MIWRRLMNRVASTISRLGTPARSIASDANWLAPAKTIADISAAIHGDRPACTASRPSEKATGM